MSYHNFSTLIERVTAVAVISAAISLQGCRKPVKETADIAPNAKVEQGAAAHTLEEQTARFCEPPGVATSATDTLALGDSTNEVEIIRQVQSDAYQRGLNVPPLRCVVRDSAQWNLIRSLFVNTSWQSEPFDFARVQIIIATHGLTANDGPQIRIPAIKRQGATLEAQVLNVPTGACIAGETRTSPLTAVVIPRSTNPVRFKEWLLVIARCH
jgi:hypothetical protein